MIQEIQPNFIDLHSHSTYSDGLLSPTELVQRAYEKGIKMLALTDHDSIKGLPEACQKAQSLGIQLIHGVEISTDWNKKGIHIVGLNFDAENKAMQKFLQQQQNLRTTRAIEIGACLAKAGVPNAYEETKKLSSGDVTRAHYARYLVQIGKVSNEKQAFKRFLGQGKGAYVKTPWCDIPSAIEIIHQAGGVAVLAHPLRYNFSRKQIILLTQDFKNWGGDGIEVAGCGQRLDQRQFLAKLAQEYQLLASVGSDFHYPCAWRELGRDLNLLPESLPIWENWSIKK